MDEARKLLSITREWPWGLVLLTDSGSSSPVPAQLDGGVAASLDVVAVGIQHEVDGAAVAEVWLGPLQTDMRCIYDGEFVTVCGAAIVGDAGYQQHSTVEIGEGSHRLRVFVDQVRSAELVVFEFGGSGNGTT